MSKTTAEDKRLHLQFIQNAIERMASNSFLIKGWSITVFGGLFTIYIANQDKNWGNEILCLAIILALGFWIHDAYYLKLEREFRNLYNKVSQQPTDKIDYSLTMKDSEKEKWHKVAVRPIILVSYFSVIVVASILLVF